MRKLPVFLTVDTEIWPYKKGWPANGLTKQERDLSRQFEHCVLGISDTGEFGVRYQLGVLNAHGLRASFFVEPLHSAAGDKSWLQKTVRMICEAGHDVQLHAHTEWLSEAVDPPFQEGYRQFISQYAFEHQVAILTEARRLLEEAGAPPPVAFRAGSFGANLDTLSALRRVGIKMDSSMNHCCVGASCFLDAPPHPSSIEGVIEFPMAVFNDFGSHIRPAQLAACSAAEMEHALWQARRHAWPAFVVLWHGSEFLKQEFHPERRARPSRIVLHRFGRLCRFLAKHKNEFEAVVFSEIDPKRFLVNDQPPPVISNIWLTAHRMVEQAVGRFR